MSMSHLAYVQDMIRMGYLNRPGSTDVDAELAMDAIEAAIRLDDASTT